MKLSLVLIVFLLAFTTTIVVHADGEENWGIQVKTLPPSPNPNPNNMTALHLVLDNFTVLAPTAQLSQIVYNESTFKLDFNVTVTNQYAQDYAPVHITFPTTLANPAQNIGIYVDGDHNSYILSSEQGKWFLSFELPLGTHTILLDCDPYQYPVEVIPEFHSGYLLILMMALLGTTMYLLTKKKE
jgi:hypothetical protein